MLNTPKFNESLARKHILEWPLRDLLNRKTLQLHTASQAVGKLHVHWSLTPDIHTDPDFSDSGRDTVYYVRAIEGKTPAIDVDPLGCEYDEVGRCVDVRPCFGRPADDNCLSETEQRAWSSPIFVDYKKNG